MVGILNAARLDMVKGEDEKLRVVGAEDPIAIDRDDEARDVVVVESKRLQEPDIFQWREKLKSNSNNPEQKRSRNSTLFYWKNVMPSSPLPLHCLLPHVYLLYSGRP